MEVVGRWLWLWHIQLSAPKFVLPLVVLYLTLRSRCSARNTLLSQSLLHLHPPSLLRGGTM